MCYNFKTTVLKNGQSDCKMLADSDQAYILFSIAAVLEQKQLVDF